jgi:hypothetical protein
MSPRFGKKSVNEQSKTKERKGALSLSVKTSRFPCVDMTEVDDVATKICVELGREIMKRPDISTGKFFEAIAASKSDVNRADTVVVVTAAVLNQIGNGRAAESVLRRSKTVANFYADMGLEDPVLRGAFVVMLFTIAPEFVKMIESTVIIAIERVQDMTTAEHGDRKLLEATGELAKSGTVSPEEHASLLEDLTRMRLTQKAAIGDSSIQTTPTDGIAVNDSISVANKQEQKAVPAGPNTVDLMRKIRDNRGFNHSELYKDYPNLRRPVNLTPNMTRAGIGYKPAESAITGAQTESNFGDSMNAIYGTTMASRRHRLTNDEKRKYSRSDSFVTAKSNPSTAENTATFNLSEPYLPEYNEVTRDDIEAFRTQATAAELGYSEVITADENDDDASSLLDLL